MVLCVPKGTKVIVVGEPHGPSGFTFVEDAKVEITGRREDKGWWLARWGIGMLAFTDQQVQELEQEL